MFTGILIGIYIGVFIALLVLSNLEIVEFIDLSMIFVNTIERGGRR